PITQGLGGASGYCPLRAWISAKLSPDAFTSITSSSFLGTTSGTSCTSSALYPPSLVFIICRMGYLVCVEQARACGQLACGALWGRSAGGRPQIHIPSLIVNTP